jgi:uncharacterized membrane protein
LGARDRRFDSVHPYWKPHMDDMSYLGNIVLGIALLVVIAIIVVSVFGLMRNARSDRRNEEQERAERHLTEEVRRGKTRI